jgi:hypothetical protein
VSSTDRSVAEKAVLHQAQQPRKYSLGLELACFRKVLTGTGGTKMATDSKSSSFPTPRIASSKTETESLDLEDIDMSQDGVQENVVVTKGRAATFVRRVPDNEKGR